MYNILITYLKQKGFLPVARHVYMYLFLSFFKFPYIPFFSQYTFSLTMRKWVGMAYIYLFVFFSPKMPSGYNCEVNALELAKLSGSPVNGLSGSMLSLVALAVFWEELLKVLSGCRWWKGREECVWADATTWAALRICSHRIRVAPLSCQRDAHMSGCSDLWPWIPCKSFRACY